MTSKEEEKPLAFLFKLPGCRTVRTVVCLIRLLKRETYFFFFSFDSKLRRTWSSKSLETEFIYLTGAQHSSAQNGIDIPQVSEEVQRDKAGPAENSLAFYLFET